MVSMTTKGEAPPSVVLVTGCAGFIGARVTSLLLAQGVCVVGVDDLNDAYDVRLKEWRLTQLRDLPGFDFRRLDIRNRTAIEALFDELATAATLPGAVINLAARAGVPSSVQNPWVYFETNVTGTLNLLEACKDHGVGKLVLSSSSSLYGARNDVPFSEGANTDHPLSPYAASKKAAEVLCHTYHYLYGLDVTVFRYFTVYGPAGRPDMSLFRFVRQVSEGLPVTIFGDGQQSRDFTYVDDIAAGTIAGLRETGYETINLGSDRPIRLIDALRKIEALVGKKAKVEFKPFQTFDVPATWADIGRAERVLGWKPRTSFEEGLERLVAWYNENRAWASKIQG
jgi:nucleoside-diphosphate-sugar epimerase